MSRLLIPIFALAVSCSPLASFAADHDHGNLSEGSKDLHEVMEESAEKMPSMKMSGDVDKDFAKMMAHHHRSGIEMAKIQSEHGKNKELKQLAQKMMKSQKEELETLEEHAEMTH